MRRPAGGVNLRFLALAGRIVRQLLRDHRTVALILVVPSLVMLLLGYLLTGQAVPGRVAVLQEDRPVNTPAGEVRVGEQLLVRLEESELVTLEEISGDDWRSKLEEGDLDAVLAIPEGLTRGLLSGTRRSLHLHLGGTEPGPTAQIRRALLQAVQDLAADLPGAAASPLSVEIDYLYGGEDYDTLDYFAPGFVGGFVFFFVFLLTSVSFLRERSGGTIERLSASPIRTWEIVLGYLLGFSLFAVAEASAILLFALYVLQVKTVGSIGVVLLIVLLLTLGAISLGVFLSFYAHSELQVMQFVPVVIIPQLLLGGLVRPVHTMVPFLRRLAALMPMTYATRALKDVMMRGRGLSGIGSELAFLLGFAVLMIISASISLRREM